MPETSKIQSASGISVLTPAERQRLERLRLAPRRRFAGRVRGERTSRQKGVSIEFADYRDYAAGDDLRSLDWNILARLDRPTIRTYQDEDDLAVYLLLDMSASMDFGNPSKFHAARKAAAAVGFIALAGQDAVYPIAIGGSAEGPRALRSRASAGALDRWAASLEPSGSASLAATLSHMATSGSMRPGMAVCITDALDAAAPQAIRALGARGHEVLVIQILSNIEIDPEMEGDLRLLDSETGAPVDITANAEALRIYKANLTAHCQAVEDEAGRLGGRYIKLLAHQPIIETLTHELRRAGALQR